MLQVHETTSQWIWIIIEYALQCKEIMVLALGFLVNWCIALIYSRMKIFGNDYHSKRRLEMRNII